MDCGRHGLIPSTEFDSLSTMGQAKRRKMVVQFKAPERQLVHVPELATLQAVEWALDRCESSERALKEAVGTAREDGHTWRAIASALGISAQAAHKKFSP